MPTDTYRVSKLGADCMNTWHDEVTLLARAAFHTID